MTRGRTFFALRGQQRADAHADAGFTLIELAAALTIMAVGIVGVIGVMNGSFRVAVNASARSKAVSVATRVIEEMRAMEYDAIDVPGLGDPLVAYPPVDVDGRTFDVQRTVTWADEAATPTDGRSSESDAYKHVVVVVSWEESDGVKFVQQETFLYPGGQGRFTAVTVPAPVGNGRPLAPSNLLPTVATGIGATAAVDLVWTPPLSSNPEVATYVVQYSTDASFTTYQEVTDSVSALHPTLRVSGLAGSTTYHFRVASKAANGELSSGWATALNVQTLPIVALTCSIGEVNATPAAVRHRNGSGRIASDIVVSANGTGLCTTTSLRMEYTPVAGGTEVVLPLTRTGSIFTGSAPGFNTVWTVGDHEIEIFDSANTKRATINVTICERHAVTCG